MKTYRNAYKQRIRGDYSDEYTRKILFNDQLIEGMNFHKNIETYQFCGLLELTS